MNPKLHLTSLLALAISGLTADACILTIRVACPNDLAAANVRVCVEGADCGYTDDLGVVTIPVNSFGTYKVCVDTSTLPPGASVSPSCKNVKVESDAPPTIEFGVTGKFCETPPPPGPCWLTGGGTVDKVKGANQFSFGGVVYPGCSPKAAEGGNWNVVHHPTGLHFQGQSIIVDECSGVPTSSPRVTVNVIDFHGEGIIDENGINQAKIPVTFVGRAVDNKESGAGSDLLFIEVKDGGGNVVMRIGNSAADPAVLTSGNLQIHQTSCK